MNTLRSLFALAALLALAGAPVAAARQQPAAPSNKAPEGGAENQALPITARLVVEPMAVQLEVGGKTRLSARLLDGDTEITDRPVVFFSRDRRRVSVKPDGELEALGPGTVTVVALIPKDSEDEPRRAEALLQAEIEVTVPNPPVATVAILDFPTPLYAQTRVSIPTHVVDRSGVVRSNVELSFSSSNSAVAAPDGLGHLDLMKPGTIRLTAKAENATTSVDLRVSENPAVRLDLSLGVGSARTGDVVTLQATGYDTKGKKVEGLPIEWSVIGEPAPEILAAGAPAAIYDGDKFVAERSGVYTLVATSGPLVARRSLRVAPRNVHKEIKFVGQGKVRDRHTSDLWIWTGNDGRDYAITGTWGAEGHAYFWDVTNPENIVLIDTVKVDARTVNDVKLSEDGKIAVISREGASNRKNGIVLLDVSDPQNGVRILSRFDDQLRGGVHNVFVSDHHVYAVNNGRKFDVINIEDPATPYRVAEYELDTPGHAIHDVWVSNGVAFTSNWDDGVWAIDVGGGGQGGSPKKPVTLGHYEYPSGWNHAAFPYRSKSTGKFYLFAGDEAFPYGLSGREQGEAPPRAAGWVHIVEWDEWNKPREVARYQVPEAGTHNLWIEDDMLYVAYYNGGLRVVDISGELRGDLYRQGREIGLFMPFDPEGFIPNSPFVWGPQPHKGTIFFSDWNSGLWAVKLVDPEKPGAVIGEPQ